MKFKIMHHDIRIFIEIQFDYEINGSRLILKTHIISHIFCLFFLETCPRGPIEVNTVAQHFVFTAWSLTPVVPFGRYI